MTMILVTHDKNEALQLSDRIALMKHGDIIQYDKPYNMYTSPISKEVADYFGRNNYFLGKVKDKVFKCEYFESTCDEKDGNYEAMIRPSAIIIDENKKDFIIKEINYLGDTVEVMLNKNKTDILVKTSADILNRDYFKVENKVGIKIKEKEISYFLQ